MTWSRIAANAFNSARTFVLKFDKRSLPIVSFTYGVYVFDKKKEVLLKSTQEGCDDRCFKALKKYKTPMPYHKKLAKWNRWVTKFCYICLQH